jgi:acetoacetate decarboxylase
LDLTETEVHMSSTHPTGRQPHCFMPALMGPPSARGVAHYSRVDVVAAQWRLHRDLLAGLLPDCFLPVVDGPEQSGLLTVAFADNQGVEFMAGRGYRVASVLVRAAFEKQEGPQGDFVVAMFEDDTLPIVLGRELLGLPKLFADISIEDRPGRLVAARCVSSRYRRSQLRHRRREPLQDAATFRRW